MAKLVTLTDLLVQELRDLYSAERQLTKALPKMATAASSPDLADALEEHLAVTQKQIERLDRAFELLGKKPKAKKCKAMAGLIDEAKELMQAEADPDVRDAALIGAAQKVEHYEIAGYGTARAYARQLDQHELAALLQDTLDEESEADEQLSRLALRSVNRDAAEGAEAEAEPAGAS